MQRCIVAAQVHPPPEISTGIILAASLIATDRFSVSLYVRTVSTAGIGLRRLTAVAGKL